VPGGLTAYETTRTENADEVKEIVVKIYELTRRHHPDREADLPALLRNYRGREGQLLARLVEKPDLLLKLKRSFESKKNLLPFAPGVEAFVAQQRAPGGAQTILPKVAGSADLFASLRGSIAEGDVEGLGNLLGESLRSSVATAAGFAEPDGEDEEEEEPAGAGDAARKPRRTTVASAAAAGKKGGVLDSMAAAAASSVRTMVDTEAPFESLSAAQQAERIKARPVSTFVSDPSFDVQSMAAVGAARPKDKAECVLAVGDVVARAKLLEALRLEDAVVVLVELRLRGDHANVVGSMGRGAQLAVKATCANAADSGKALNAAGVPPEAESLLKCYSDADIAKLLQSIPLSRSATLLVEMLRRGSAGPVCDALTPGGLGAMLAHLPPRERAGLVVGMQPVPAAEALKSMDFKSQVLTLGEMAPEEAAWLLSGHFEVSEAVDLRKGLARLNDQRSKKSNGALDLFKSKKAAFSSAATREKYAENAGKAKTAVGEDEEDAGAVDFEDDSDGEAAAYEQYLASANALLAPVTSEISSAATKARDSVAAATAEAAAAARVQADAATATAAAVASLAAKEATDAGSGLAASAQGAVPAMPEVDVSLDPGDVALPSWAVPGARPTEPDYGDDDDGAGKSVFSDATTNLSGVSERGAGDGSVLEQMVWSFLMSGLPSEEQAKYNALAEEDRRQVMGKAATAAQGSAPGGQFATMSSAEAAAAALKQRQAAAEAEASPWSLFTPAAGGLTAGVTGAEDKNDPGVIGNFLAAAKQEATLRSARPEAPAESMQGDGFPTWLSPLGTVTGSVAGVGDGLGKGLEAGGGQLGALFGTTTTQVVAALSREAPATTLARHRASIAALRAAKLAANVACAMVDRRSIEAGPAPEPLVGSEAIPGFVEVERVAQGLFSAQDAKLLSSKWGISVTEIKFIAHQMALLSPGGSGLLDPRLVPHLLNRLGYFETLDSTVLPKDALPRPAKDKKGNDKGVLTFGSPEPLRHLNAVEVADCFGKAAFALAEANRFSGGGDKAGNLTRMSLDDCQDAGLTPVAVLAKDPVAALAGIADHRLACFLFTFTEMVQQSVPEPMSADAAAAMDQGKKARDFADHRMETRLLGRALRRVGFGRPSGEQAEAVLQWTGVRLPLPADAAADAGPVFAAAAAAASRAVDSVEGLEDVEALASAVGESLGPKYIGMFEFLAACSVMLSPHVNALSVVDTSALPNGDRDAPEDEDDLLEVQRTAKFVSEAAALEAAVVRAAGRAGALAAKVNARAAAEAAALKALEVASGEPHGFSGGQAILLGSLFDLFAEDFELNRKRTRVVNRGLRSLLRAVGCFPTEVQLRAVRDRFGDLGLNVGLAQFGQLARHLHHWFPVATPHRILAIAGRRHVSLFEAAARVAAGPMDAPGSLAGIAVGAGHPTVQAMGQAGLSVADKAYSGRGTAPRSVLANRRGSVVVSPGEVRGGILAAEAGKPDKPHKEVSSDPLSNFLVADVFKLEHAFGIYDYDRDSVLDQGSLRALLRRLHVNWSAKQFVRVTRGALGTTMADYDVDDFVCLLALTSAHMVETKAAKKEGQAGRRVANHHAKILYSHFSVVWNLPPLQLQLIQRTFLAEEAAARGGGEEPLVPRTRVRGILATLGVNFARVEASGLSETFDLAEGGRGVDFDELLGLVAHLVHTYGFIGDGVDDALTSLGDGAVADARRIFNNQASDPGTNKSPAKACLLSLRQMGLVSTDMELDRALRLSGTMPQYRAGWLSWPAFVRLLAQLNHQKAKDDKLRRAAREAEEGRKQRKAPEVALLVAPGSRRAHDGDMAGLRSELEGFVEEHSRFEDYMERLNHTYKILQKESSRVVPARPPEPDEGPLSKKEQRSRVSAKSFHGKAKGGSSLNRGSGSFRNSSRGSRDSSRQGSRESSRQGSRESSLNSRTSEGRDVSRERFVDDHAAGFASPSSSLSKTERRGDSEASFHSNWGE